VRKLPIFALVYDFDGTIAPGNMQERDFIPATGMTTKKFWDEVNIESKSHQADNILIYMKLMLDKADAAQVAVHKKDFESYGQNLPFFKGILPYKNSENNQEKGWFDRISEYGKQSHVKVEHYIVSSGIREMILGTKIAKKFEAIYASSFYYNHNDIAVWPSLALNYTTKTQYLFRINKGCLDISDNKKINEYTPETERRIPFKNMVYLGDGETDIPCFRLIKDRGGNSIGVYKPNTKGAKNKLHPLIKNGRVNFLVQADYRNGTLLDRVIKGLIDKIQQDEYLKSIV
jgi:hypothetical protein